MRSTLTHVLAATLGLSGLAVAGCAHKSAAPATTTTTAAAPAPAPAVENPPPAKAVTVNPNLTRVDIKGTSIIPKEKIQFDVGKAVVLAGSDDELADIVTVLKDNPDVKLEIEGHTSAEGGAALNKKLSQERADAVKAWLVAHGVVETRLTARGWGSEKPIGDDHNEEGREKNRRVDFTIVSTEAAK